LCGLAVSETPQVEGFLPWAERGQALAAELDYAGAITALRHALALRPDEPWLRVNLARALFALGHVSEAVEQNERAVHDAEGEVRDHAIRNAAIMVPGDPQRGNQVILGMRRRWARLESASVQPLQARPARGEKIRLGYYGAFFDKPNWMKMYMGVINAHDRDRFEINLIVDGGAPSATSGYRDQAADRIWEVDGVPNDRLAALVAEAPIDVLVDLNGFSHAARLPLLAYRAAPVQVAWNGMYGTTGISGLDALVGDGWVVPPGEERFCTERVRRVTQTYLPFQVFYPTPEVAPPPCLKNGHVTFGSFASAYKLTATTLAAWSAVLRAVPGSRLLLRNRALEHAGNRAELVGRFAALGIAPERLTLLGGAGHEAFLRSYDAMDLSLDSFPYNGGTTTAEALWQGVPVLTIKGDRWAGRTSRSILMAAGFSEFIADDGEGFVALAVRLAGDASGLAARRSAQREILAASPACDPAALCRELETIYRELLDHAA
jgi:protein O-GlcNAc transferase